MFEWLIFAASLAAVAFVTCCCTSCNVVRAITSWGSDSTTIGNGATEQNGNWEILSGKLRVATADAIITWDAGIDEWVFRFDPFGMTWEIPTYPGVGWQTDYTKELRFIWNYIDNSNYDYCSLRFLGIASVNSPADYLVSFGTRAAGVDSVELPGVAWPARAIPEGQYRMSAGYSGSFSSFEWLEFSYKDGAMRIPQYVNSSCLDSACAGQSWQRTRVNNIVGIGTGPSWTGNVDINQVYITSPDADEANACNNSDECPVAPRPACGCTSAYVAKTLTVTIAGTPYTCYQSTASVSTPYYWRGTTAFDADVEITSAGVINVYKGSDAWQLTNGGNARTDCDAWTSLNIPPVAPNVQTCTITGNY